MAKKNTTHKRLSDEFIGLMERVRKELNLNISDPECSRYIARNYKEWEQKRKQKK